ncbi:uncharacterized protein V6R79_025070 [Siganus canaliculatus]
MSNQTFNTSTEQVEHPLPFPHRDLQLVVSCESRSSSSLSPSPDSNSSFSNMSDTNVSPDVLGSHGDESPYPTTLQLSNKLCGTATSLTQTFIATPVSANGDFWNENINLQSSQEEGSEKYQTFSNNSEDGRSSEVMSSDSAGRDSLLDSCETSRRGSTENDCCSLSSGEMVMRSNSFCLADQSLLVISSLEDSSVSLASGLSALPSECNQLSTTVMLDIMLDICENSPKGVAEGSTGHPSLGTTFTQAEEPPAGEKSRAASSSVVALPSENEGGLLMTFVCETSPGDGGKESASTKPLLLDLPEALTPEQGKAFTTSTLSAVYDTDKNIHTSTPVQNIGNKKPSLPSFSESPCSGATAEPNRPSGQQQQMSASPIQRLVAGLSPSSSKVKKTEIKKFPKSDYSSVKSKVVTRNVNHMSGAGTAPLHRPQQMNVSNKHSDSHKGASRVSPTKLRISTKVGCAAPRPVNTEAGNLDVTSVKSSGQPAVSLQDKSEVSPPSHPAAENKPGPDQRCDAASEAEHGASSQVANAKAEHAGNQTFCLSSLEKSPERSGQIEPKPTPKKGVSHKIEVRSATAFGQDKPPVLKMRPRCSSESSSSSRPPKETKTPLRSSTSFMTPKTDPHLGQTKPGEPSKRTVQAEATKGPAAKSKREAKKISLVKESRKLTVGASLDEIKRRIRVLASPRLTRTVAPSQAPAASPRPAPASARHRQTALVRDETRTWKGAGTPQSKLRGSMGSQRAQAGGESTTGITSTTGVKPQLNGFKAPHTPSRSSLMGPPPPPPTTPASRVPRRTLGPSRVHTEGSAHTEQGEGAVTPQVSGGAAHKPSPFKAAVLKNRIRTTSTKNTESALAIVCKPATAATSKGGSTVSPLRRTSSARFARLTSSVPEMLWSPKLSLSNIHVRLTAKGLLRNIQLLSGCRKNTVVFQTVDKTKPKASPRQQPAQQRAPQSSQSNGPPDVVPASVCEGGRKEQSIRQLGELLTASNCRFEAVTVVLQKTLAERDEATRQCRDLSQELVNLRGELVSSVQSSERLEKEKDELRVALDDALQSLQEQHQKDLAELEQRLQTFYQAEWDKVHVTYQEEADKCKTLIQQQMVDLKANHEAMKQDLEKRHTEQLQGFKQQHDASLEELCRVHQQELQILEKTLKDAEAALSEQIEALTAENNVLTEKLSAEESRRKELAERSQKDSHTLYLEQELESLKVVLDIKNEQLHQQEKKLMEVDKLKEKNVKLDEGLKKVQQENEDLKARMDRHAALSRQLSSEQAVLQESLQKESKVNKRLSMENEELLWKLHNGDLSSPRKVSPSSTSPSHSFSLQSPRSSGLFSSHPVSPR